MTSRYAPARAIPPGFPDVLRDFSREVLRNFPRGSPEGSFDAKGWVLEFAAEYFASGGKRVSGSQPAAGGAGAAAPGAGSQAVDDLESKIVEIFRSADRDGSGSLDQREFKAVLRTIGEELGLELPDVRLLMSLCDLDGDGRVTYVEFLPLALQVVSLIAAKQREGAERDKARHTSLQGAQFALVHGLTAAELQQKLVDAFSLVDADNDGLISAGELAAALHGSGLGLSRKDVNLLMSEADTDKSGRLDFSEFAPVCFNLLADNIAKQLEIELTPTETHAIAALLLRECEAYDPGNTGQIPLVAVSAVLRDSDLHLSWLQQQAIAAQAAPDASGTVDYRAFVGPAASFIRALLKSQTDLEYVGRLLEARASPTVNGMDKAAFNSALLTVLQAVDTKGNGKARLTDLRPALQAGMGLDDRQADALLSAAASLSEGASDGAGSAAGAIDLRGLAQCAFGVLQQLAELELLTGPSRR